ncbi:hypothetical protein GCM10020000_20240 [Streptomyces olivoverticillatus]
MATRGALGERLGGQQQPGVGQFGDGVHADDARLPEQVGDGGVGQAGAAHGVPGGGGGAVPGALDDDERLAGRGAPGEAGELPGIADGLQVHQGDVGVRVVVPVLEEVVARDVGAVSGGDEGGDADEPGGAPVQPAEEGDADRAGLAEQADPAGGWQLGRERGVEPDGFGGVHQAEGVGPDDPHAVRAGSADQLALAAPACRAALGISGGEDHEPLDTVLAAVVDGLRHVLGGHGDDGEVDRVRDLADGAVGGHALGL